jgi:hypothetical protein
MESDCRLLTDCISERILSVAHCCWLDIFHVFRQIPMKELAATASPSAPLNMSSIGLTDGNNK